MYENYRKLRDSRGYKDADVSRGTGIGKSTFSDWKSGRSEPGPAKMVKIANFLGVSTEYLVTGDMPEESPPLTKRDERDIQKHLSMFRDQLIEQEGLMFDGKPVTQEDVESILDAMQIGMELVKKRNKEKYTPKKYRN
ncbi:helix-turn-helix protein [Popillia japonica]|uniref:Helix-turn-helix protein n=1 Tax=Popillia japonica TaxID=7064 RepID=A0AAW1HVF8_POPJA